MNFVIWDALAAFPGVDHSVAEDKISDIGTAKLLWDLEWVATSIAIAKFKKRCWLYPYIGRGHIGIISPYTYTIPIFRLVLQICAILGCFPYILFCRYLVSLLSSGWFVIAVCASISVQGASKVFRIIANWCRIAISNKMSTYWVPSLFVFFFYIFFS